MKSPKELMARYPYQFAGEHISMSFARGWFSIFAQLCADIDQALGDDKRGFRCVQVKEKFGQARVYYQLDEDFFEREPELATKLMKLKVAAEVATATVCAVCGRPGSINEDMVWKLALCDEHRHQVEAGRAPSIWFEEDDL